MNIDAKNQKKDKVVKDQKRNFYQKGVSLLMTFFIMLIALAVIISISSFVYNEIKIIKDAGDATVSFYLAYSGVEKAMYYAKKNVCLTYPYNVASNPNGCLAAGDDKDLFLDKSLYCNNQSEPKVLDFFKSPLGCDASKCDSCKISFTTTLDEGSYKVSVSTQEKTPDLVQILISSRGTFNKSSRQLEVLDTTEAK